MPIIPSILLSASLICGAGADAVSIEKALDALNCDSIQTYIYSGGTLKDLLCDIGINYDNGACEPSVEPTDEPTATPTVYPTSTPTVEPTASPTGEPTATPTVEPTATPTVEPTATPTASPVTDSEFAAEVIRLVNAERAKQGLSELSTAEDLTAAANQRAVEISSVFSHTRPNGSSFSTVLGEYGVSYKSAGENIAYGQKTPEAVVEAWMNSSGHRANILSSSYSKIGVGVYKSGNTYYWTQLFTG
ncbi:MAG: CAP domain-containing protein [Firmicutes bacterium]|nr:CAP domain-containing protein [Bacillota bacterium]